MSIISYEFDVREFNESKWLKIFYHNSTNGVFFKKENPNEALYVNQTQKFSILKYLPRINRFDSDFEFILEYPEINETLHWRQSANPLTTYQNPEHEIEYNYEAIDVPEDNVLFKGLVRSHPQIWQSNSTLLFGVPENKLWYNSIGAYHNWTLYDTFPGSGCINETDGKPMLKHLVQEAVLWIRIKEYFNIFLPFCSCQQRYTSYRMLFTLIMLMGSK